MCPIHRVLIALIATGAVLSVSVTSFASCVPPETSLSRSSGSLGDEVVVTGRWWLDGCNDVGGVGMCSQDHPEPTPPIEDITIGFMGPMTKELRREWNRRGTHDSAEHFVDLAEVDADHDGRFRTEISVPDLPPGRYVVTSEFGEDSEFVIND